MAVYIAGQAVEVRAAQPWRDLTGTVHRGLGGRTQTVWTGAAPDAGQRVTVRMPAAQVAGFLATVHAPRPVDVTADGPCPIMTGTAVVTNSRVTWVYDIDPPAADVDLEMAWVA